MTVIEMVKEYLKKNDYDGLYNIEGDCACEISNLAPCGENFSDCKPGYKVVPPDDIKSDFDFYICPNKDDKPWENK